MRRSSSRGYPRHRNRSRSPLFTKYGRQRGYQHNNSSNHHRGRHDDPSQHEYNGNVDERRQRSPFNSHEEGYHYFEPHEQRYNDDPIINNNDEGENLYGEGPSWQNNRDGAFHHEYEDEDEDLVQSYHPPPSVRSRLGPNHKATHGMKRMKGMVRLKEVVDEDVLIMELTEASHQGLYLSVFVHRSSLFFPRGDNFGYCDRFANRPGLKMTEFFKVGQLFNFEGEETLRVNCGLKIVAFKVWPRDCQEPQTSDGNVDDQISHFHLFLSNFDRNKLAFACLGTVYGSTTGDVQMSAHVSKIVTDKYGVIEVRGVSPKALSLQCLFHYDSVWLEDGKNAREALGYTKVLNDLVHVGMDVNLTARSIIKFKGHRIVQSKLELQAVMVFIRPYAMPNCMPQPTRIKTLPGSIGISRKYTSFFFNASLLYTLNSQLSEFINITKEIDPLIERSYLNPSVDLELLLNNKDRRLKRDSFGQTPSVRMDIIGAKGRIVCLFDDEDGCVIECIEGGEKCYFSGDNLFKRKGGEYPFREVCAYGKVLSFNASLIDLHSKVPYLASEVWDEDLFPPQEHASNHDQGQLERFERVNKNLGEDFLCPQNAENASGIVYRILDDNFGLLQWDRNNKLTLFDTCDLWLEDNCTAEKVKKSLKDVIKVHQPLSFHALLINKGSKIPYLTSAIWDPRNPKLRNYPPFVERSQIHAKKISIYNVVLKSVVEKLFPKDPNERTGKVLTILTMNNVPRGGVLLGDDGDEKSFFEVEGSFQNFAPGCQVKYIVKRGEAAECPFSLGIRVSYPNTDFPPFNKNKDDESTARTLSRWTELSLDPREVQEGFFEVPCRDSLPPEDEAVSAGLVCMINRDSGVLRNNYDSSKLCYFEVEDLNLESLNESITLKDLGTLLGNEIPSIQVAYQSSRPRDCPPGAPIQYIANRGGVQVTASSPLPSFIRLKESHKSYEPDMRTSKHSRWRYANQVFTKEDVVMPLERILRGDYPSQQESTLIMPTLMIASSGRVRHILNENFGIVQEERSGAYCLFDTYDLYANPKSSAAELNKSVRDVVSIGDEVEFNATLVRNLKKIPYLVTGLWGVRLSDQMAHVLPVSLDAIQSDKINVYDTVSDSCAKMVTLREESVVDTRQILERKKYIQKAYSSESYIKYISSLPRAHRTSRDPSTPEPEFCDDDPGDLIRWREHIVDWLSDQLNRVSYETQFTRMNNAADDHFLHDVLNDENTTGRLYISDEACDFGVIRLDNGAKALLHRERVWLTNRPLGQNADLGILIRKEYFREIHVKARLLPPGLRAETGVEYQVIYCHSGANLPRRRGDRTFEYGLTMMNWMDSLLGGDLLEKELEAYINVLVDNRMTNR